ncbi:MAG TPA: hypothetical protein VKB45_08760 [Gemmatimonadales bacterium]|nr:hypothetical protein [Gemmatimonadales bacterium]
MRRPRSRFAAALILTASWGAASCSDGTAPAAIQLPPFAGIELAAEDSLIYYSDLGQIIGRWIAPGGVLHGAPAYRGAALPPGIRGAGAALFADSVLGKTFTFDCALFRYVRDDTLTGAPASGIRIALYRYDDSFAPECPLVPRGRLDLTDISDSQPALGVTLQDSAAVTSIQFTLRALSPAMPVAISLVGTLSNGAQHFMIAATRQVLDPVFHVRDSVTFVHLETAATLRITHATGDSVVTGSAIGTRMQDDLRISQGTHTVQYSALLFECSTCAFRTGSGTVTVDDRVFGTAVLSPDSIHLVGPGGRAVVPEESSVMRGMIGAPDLTDYALRVLVAPLGTLIGATP